MARLTMGPSIQPSTSQSHQVSEQQIISKPVFSVEESVEVVQKPVFKVQEVEEIVSKPAVSIKTHTEVVRKPEFTVVEEVIEVKKPRFVVVDEDKEVPFIFKSHERMLLWGIALALVLQSILMMIKD